MWIQLVASLDYGMYMVIFAVLLFSQISRVRPRKNFHFNLCLFIVTKTSENGEINPSQISAPSPKSRKYLYAKMMAYTVGIFWEKIWKTLKKTKETKISIQGLKFPHFS